MKSVRQQTVTCEREEDGRGDSQTDGKKSSRQTDRQTDTEQKMADQCGPEKERNSSVRTSRLLIRTYWKEEHIKRVQFESLYVLG